MISKWPTHLWKGAQLHQPLGEDELELQGDTLPLHTVWLKFKRRKLTPSGATGILICCWEKGQLVQILCKVLWHYQLSKDFQSVVPGPGAFRKYKFSGLTPDLLNQKPQVCPRDLWLNKPSWWSDSCEILRTTVLKLNICLPCNPEIGLLEVTEMCTNIPRKTCTRMST